MAQNLIFWKLLAVVFFVAIMFAWGNVVVWAVNQMPATLGCFLLGLGVGASVVLVARDRSGGR